MSLHPDDILPSLLLLRYSFSIAMVGRKATKSKTIMSFLSTCDAAIRVACEAGETFSKVDGGDGGEWFAREITLRFSMDSNTYVCSLPEWGSSPNATDSEVADSLLRIVEGSYAVTEETRILFTEELLLEECPPSVRGTPPVIYPELSATHHGKKKKSKKPASPRK